MRKTFEKSMLNPINNQMILKVNKINVAHIFLKQWLYKSESKVLQYSGNSAAPDGFAKIKKITIYTGLWDVELTWYYQSATLWIRLGV